MTIPTTLRKVFTANARRWKALGRRARLVPVQVLTLLLVEVLFPLFQRSMVTSPNAGVHQLELLARSRRLTARTQRALLARPAVHYALLRNPALTPEVQREAALLGGGALEHLACNDALLPEVQAQIIQGDNPMARVGLALNASLAPEAETALAHDEVASMVLVSRRNPRVHLDLPVQYLWQTQPGRELLDSVRSVSPEAYDTLAPGFAGTGTELLAVVKDFS